MSFKPVTERSFDLPLPGGQLGVITALVELGTQRQKYSGDDAETAGEEYKDLQTAAVVIELTSRPIPATGRNHELALRINLEALGERSWQRKVAEATRTFKPGVPYDITQVVGKALQVQIFIKERNRKKYANITEVMVVPEETIALVKPPQRRPFLWELGADIRLLDDLPRLYGQKLADLVKDSPEWQAHVTASNGTPTATSPPSPVPVAAASTAPATAPTPAAAIPPASTPAPIPAVVHGTPSRPTFRRPVVTVAPPAPDARFWFASSEGAEMILWRAEDIQRHINVNQLDVRRVELVREGEELIHLAYEFGFQDSTPF
jgi:hypothetical protein